MDVYEELGMMEDTSHLEFALSDYVGDIHNWPVNMINPMFVTDRSPHGTMSHDIHYPPISKIEGGEEATEPEGLPGHKVVHKMRASVVAEGRPVIHTTVGYEQFGWMIPFFLPTRDIQWAALYDEIMLPTPRSLEPIPFEFNRYSVLSQTRSEDDVSLDDTPRQLTEVRERIVMLPMAPHAIVGAPDAYNFVYTPTVFLREKEGVWFKGLGPLIVPDISLYEHSNVDPEHWLEYPELVASHIDSKGVPREKVINWLV
jgi:hypothetical protein